MTYNKEREQSSRAYFIENISTITRWWNRNKKGEHSHNAKEPLYKITDDYYWNAIERGDDELKVFINAAAEWREEFVVEYWTG